MEIGGEGWGSTSALQISEDICSGDGRVERISIDSRENSTRPLLNIYTIGQKLLVSVKIGFLLNFI